MPEDNLAAVQARARAYEAVHADRGWWATKIACDLYIAAFLVPKHFRSGALARAEAPDRVPTTLDVRAALAGRQTDAQLLPKAMELADAARAFHWPLEFPAVMAAGGFDVVLGNPPWERIKLQEQEFFAAREPEIAEAPNAAARGRLIAKLKEAAPGTRNRALYDEFETAKRTAEANSVFAHVKSDEAGRFPLTGRGDVNTYALFAELFASLIIRRGRAGVIVPTGIATDATTAPFFAALISGSRLAQLIDFENRDGIFPAVHRSYKFCLLTIGREVKHADFAFFLTDVRQLAETDRQFTLSADDIARINPNTRTAPVFRSKADAELTAKIYGRARPLIELSRGEEIGQVGNPWSVDVHSRFIHVSEDSGRFRKLMDFTSVGRVRDHRVFEVPVAQSNDYIAAGRWLPLNEGEYGWIYYHRFATCDAEVVRDVTTSEHEDPSFEPEPRFWVHEDFFEERLQRRVVRHRSHLLGVRRVSSNTNERTLVGAALPFGPSTYGWILFFTEGARDSAIILSGLNSLVVDYSIRNKLSQPSIPQGTIYQLPVLPRNEFSADMISFIVPRVLELTYTSHSMTPFARDLEYNGPPFPWNEDRRAQLRAELDAWYARAYGLTRDELRYILDPADVKGADYPSETFRVLKTNEIRRFGEYRTARLVLQSWDRLESNEPRSMTAALPASDAQEDLFEVEVARGLLDTLLSDSRLYHSSADYKALLDFVVRLRNFAPFNAMLLQVQKPGLTYAASPADWLRRFGRKPKEGVRPLLILWPIGPVALVYDAADTEGRALPQDVAAFVAHGPISETEIEAFRQRTNKKNISWSDLDAGDGKAGSIRCTRKAINDNEPNEYRMLVNRNHAPPVRFATLAHELAHLFLGHLGLDKALHVPDRRNLSHQQEEVEAESVAFLVCKRNGVTSKSETYLANFVTQNSTVGDLDIYQVMRAAGQVETLLGRGAQAKF